MKKPEATNKKSFILYKDFGAQLSKLTNEQAGKLIKAVYEYQMSGAYKTDDPVVDFAMSGLVQQFTRDQEKYQRTCVKRSEAGAKGGKAKASKSKQMLANAKSAKQKVANLADNDSDSVSDNVSDSEKNIEAYASCEKIVAHYNSVCGAMPKCIKLTATRRKQILARIKEVGFDELKNIIASCQHMPHLQGNNDRGWTGDLEWITKDSNFTKIREGKYIRNTPQKPRVRNHL